MRENLKRLDPAKIRSLVLNQGQRELVLKLNEIIERVNDIEEDLSTMKGEKKWETGQGR